MPAMHYHLRWPDGQTMRCYSPSLVIRDLFAEGQALPLPEFLERIRRATHIASERVRAKYGFACSAAAAQLDAIEQRASAFADAPGAQVLMLSFDTPPESTP